MKHNKGFTLIELLVVISIIGVLSSVVLTSVSEARERAREAKLLSELRQMVGTLTVYKDAEGNGSYPGTNGYSYTDYETAMNALVSEGYFDQPIDTLAKQIYYSTPCNFGAAICGPYDGTEGFIIAVPLENISPNLSSFFYDGLDYYILGSF